MNTVEESTTFCDAKIRWPSVILSIPAAINMIETTAVLEVRSVDGELIIGVQLSLEDIL